MTKPDYRRWLQFDLKDLLIFTVVVAVGMKLHVPGYSVVHYQPLTDGSRPGQVWAGNGLGMQFRWCPAGGYTMGSPLDEQGRRPDEGPTAVTISRGFWTGKFEVTQAEWQRVMGTEPWKGEDHVKEGEYYPATFVSHDDATAYCEKLTAQERTAGRLPPGWEYRLPTHSQWEYACRAGSKTPFCFGNSDSHLREYAWFEENALFAGEQYAHEVGLKRNNSWGLCDLHGNVFEWCRDRYQEKLPGGIDPEVVSGVTVNRGGGWSHEGEYCRSAERAGAPAFRTYYAGFRVVVVRTKTTVVTQ